MGPACPAAPLTALWPRQAPPRLSFPRAWMRRRLRGSRGLVRRGREGPGGHPAGGRGLGARATFAFAERGVRPTAGRRR